MKYPDLLSAVRPIHHSKEFPVPKPLENMTCSGENSDSHEDHGQHEGANIDCD
jgi:hypothetical protein